MSIDAEYDEVPPDYDYGALPPEGVEYDDDPEFEAAGTDELAGAAPSEVIEPSEITDALTEAVRKAVAAQVADAAKRIAKGVVESALTDSVALGMAVTARREAAAAVDPDHEPEPEKAPELEYRTLNAFVDGYIANLYRREVSALGREGKTHWCPEWWKHGEVTARFEALWRAFEQSRQGKGAEMNIWWITHCDPQMAAILDPEGPFRYCSVGDGHKDKLVRLPTIPVPEGMFDDGHAHDETARDDAVLTSSRLILPDHAPTGNRRVVFRTFP
ncbi:DUF4913 domain-containing protein [Nocardia grenadensis]